ncbi:MAG: MIP family channel protein, partial [Methylocystaceae bacterium]
MRHSLPRRLLAEFLGTFWLVFGGCGSAVISAGFPQLGIGFLGVALERVRCFPILFGIPESARA